jgi:hypothetical protein
VKRLPYWLAGGPEVTDRTYRIVAAIFGDPPNPDSVPALDAEQVDVGEVIDYLVLMLEVDEYDVLQAFAELQRVGAMT